MPSQSLNNFEWNLEDVQRLKDVHGQLSPQGQGRRALGHITRSALVMLCAAWELYFEDVVCESTKFIVDNVDDPNSLPESIRKNILTHLKREKHELAMFKLAGSGWKQVYQEAAIRDTDKLNTPKSEQLGLLCKHYLGIDNISSEWQVGPDGINGIISQRGEVAHRGRDAQYINIGDLVDSINSVYLTVLETDRFLACYLKELTGSTNQPWRRKTIPAELL